MDINLISSELQKLKDITSSAKDIYELTNEVLKIEISTEDQLSKLLKARMDISTYAHPILKSVHIERARGSVQLAKYHTTSEDFYI